VLCIDFANAFNAPLRTAMAEQVQHFPNLAAIFELEYANHSKLFVRGTDRAIPSERGARQGTTSGPVFFCLAIQHMLNRLHGMRGVKVLAYMDDISLLCEDHDIAAAAMAVVQEEARKLEIAVNLKKCELFVAPSYRNSGTLAKAMGVPIDHNCLKLLGAAIGTTADEEKAKVESICGIQRYAALFRRLANGMIGAAGTAILSKCVVPKFSYAVRVHEPAVVLGPAQQFDAHVVQCWQQWAQCSVDDVSRAFAALPVRLGGLGFTPQVEIMPGAYAASRNTALRTSEEGVVLSQRAHSMTVFDKICALIDQDPAVARHREHNALPHTAALFTAIDLHVAPSDYSGALRWRLFAPVHGMVARPECPGCTISFQSPRDFMRHAPNCTAVTGQNASSRHAVVKIAVKKVCADNEVPYGSAEPRHIHVVTCPGCKEKMRVDDFNDTHGPNCTALKQNPAAASPRATGPDIVVFLPISNTHTGQLVDVTVCAAESASLCDKPIDEVYTIAEKRKTASYGAFMPDGYKLVVFGVTESGALSAQACSFLSRVVSAGNGNLQAARRAIAARVLAAHGGALANAERVLGIKVIHSAYRPLPVLHRALTFQEAPPTVAPAAAAPSAAIAPITVALAQHALPAEPARARPVSPPRAAAARPLQPQSITMPDAAIGSLITAQRPAAPTGPTATSADGAAAVAATAPIRAAPPAAAAATPAATIVDAAVQQPHPQQHPSPPRMPNTPPTPGALRNVSLTPPRCRGAVELSKALSPNRTTLLTLPVIANDLTSDSNVVHNAMLQGTGDLATSLRVTVAQLGQLVSLQEGSTNGSLNSVQLRFFFRTLNQRRATANWPQIDYRSQGTIVAGLFALGAITSVYPQAWSLANTNGEIDNNRNGLPSFVLDGRAVQRLHAQIEASKDLRNRLTTNNDNHHHNNEHAGPAPVTISAPHKNNLQQDGSSADGCQQQQAQAQRLAQQ
jgi:hypothetical protein